MQIHVTMFGDNYSWSVAKMRAKDLNFSAYFDEQ